MSINSPRTSHGPSKKTPVAIRCLQCGECCRIRGFVRLRPDEIDRIAEFLGLPTGAFTERYTRLALNRSGLELKEKRNGECIFLNGNSCTIHPVKPVQCKSFPAYWNYPGAEEICPALAGRRHAGAGHDATDDSSINKKGGGTDGQNP
jgi:Fe-S-cluster containining protein